MRVGRKRLVAGLVAAVAGSSAVAAWALSDDAPQRACDDGPIVYLYEAGETGPLSLADCPDR